MTGKKQENVSGLAALEMALIVLDGTEPQDEDVRAATAAILRVIDRVSPGEVDFDWPDDHG